MHVSNQLINGRCGQRRRGAALVEGAVILAVLFLSLCTMLDLGLAILRYNALSEASRRLARAAIVRGENALGELGVWGPDSYSATADDDSDMAAMVRPVLVTLDPATVQIHVEWPDDGNHVNDRVHVALQHEYRPLFSFGVIDETITLSASSTMRITH